MNSPVLQIDSNSELIKNTTMAEENNTRYETNERKFFNFQPIFHIFVLFRVLCMKQFSDKFDI